MADARNHPEIKRANKIGYLLLLLALAQILCGVWLIISGPWPIGVFLMGVAYVMSAAGGIMSGL